MRNKGYLCKMQAHRNHAVTRSRFGSVEQFLAQGHAAALRLQGLCFKMKVVWRTFRFINNLLT